MSSSSDSLFSKVQSPDELIQRLRFDPDPIPTDSDELLDFLKRDKDLQLRLLIRDKAKDIPLSGIVQQGGKIRITVLDTLLEPGLNPFLVLENIGVARSLLSDCLELRRRIEALQLDLFNYAQESYEFEETKKLRDAELARLADEVQLHDGLLAAKRKEQTAFATVIANWAEAMASHGADAPGHTSEHRVDRMLIQSYWPVIHSTSTPGNGTPELVKVSNAPYSALFSGSVFDIVWAAMSSDAKRSVKFETANQRNETLRLQNEKSAIDSQIAQISAAKKIAVYEHDLAKNRNAIRDEKWRRKVVQFEANSGLGLNRRLRDSLMLYSEIFGQLRVALHAIEFGQTEILGMTIEGFDAERLDLRNRYILEPASTQTQSAPGADVQESFDDGIWISLDTLGSYLVQAEARMRRRAHSTHVTQSVLRLDGELGEGSAPINLEQAIGPNSALAADTRRDNILAIRILNLGDPISLRLRLRRPQPMGQYVPPDLQHPSGSWLPDPIWKILSSYDLALDYAYLPSTSAAVAPEVPSVVTQFLNRELNGLLKATVGPAEPTARKLSLRIEVWHT
ncbi:hypothetical protein [Lysobacter sp. Root983]|uniref:hypothetical protein n=1 Tax=Lysobacter sp. Root983 TaxID=1736613 RepID=UPI00070AE158|nr:hypothetical protein [Lysobacter sp. Root983]KRD79758.1 hypothetical protein ASE43_02340 [Lysobacter sp. Root983]